MNVARWWRWHTPYLGHACHQAILNNFGGVRSCQCDSSCCSILRSLKFLNSMLYLVPDAGIILPCSICAQIAYSVREKLSVSPDIVTDVFLLIVRHLMKTSDILTIGKEWHLMKYFLYLSCIICKYNETDIWQGFITPTENKWYLSSPLSINFLFY